MNKENETRTYSISLNLTAADAQKIAEMAGASGMSVSTLLSAFVNDLTGSIYANGSDEYDLANAWFDRCWFSRFPDKTFLNYLLEREQIYDVLGLWDEISNAEMELVEIEKNSESEAAEISAIKEDIDYWREQLGDCFFSYQQETKETADSSLEEGMKKVLEWREENEQFLENSARNF